MPPEKRVYRTHRTETLADFRMLLSIRPDALYLEARELARILRCSEAEAEHVRRLLVEDGLEVAA